jgi:hypothetical protein
MNSGFDEEALRRLVREAIGRLDPQFPRDAAPVSQTVTSHASHYRYALQPSDGPCVIEPGVRCNHCGYCESHGH